MKNAEQAFQEIIMEAVTMPLAMFVLMIMDKIR